MNKHTLIIGYGNADRQDDGVGWHVIKILAEKLGYAISEDPGSFVEIKDETADLLFSLQLYPEMAEIIAQYDRVCFVDAHTANISEEISWEELHPEYDKSPLTHLVSPKTVLMIASTLFNHAPEAILISIRGYQFQFERDLSNKTAHLVAKAIDMIWDWLLFEKRPKM